MHREQLRRNRRVETPRRQLLASAGAALIAAPFIVTRTSREARAEDNTVRVLGPGVVALEDWSAFEAETGLKVEWTATDADPGLYMQEVIANTAGETYDLFCFDGGTEDTLGPQGHFLPLDSTQIKRWADIPDTVKKSPLVLDKAGTQYGVPVVFNADSFAYFPDKLGEQEPLSYKLLFDSDKTMGKVALEDTWLTTFAMAGMYLKFNKLSTIENPSNMTASEAKATADFLIERKKAGQFRAMWTTWEESIDLMANGEVLVENCWEPAVKELQKNGHKVRYATTIEGYNKWLVAAYIPSQAKDRGTAEKAYRMIDGFLGGAYGAQIAVLRGYGTGNPTLAKEFASGAGWDADKIAAIDANVQKLETKFAAELFWQNANPDGVKDIETEWQRFVQA